jgi:type IV pilus assembly protein PilB
MAIKLGELLLQEERITSEQLQAALEEQRLNGGRLGSNLIKLGFVRDEDIISLLSRQYGVPAINLNQFDPDPEVVRLISAETASKYQVIPVGRTGMALTLAMADPTNVFAMDDIKFMTGLHIEPVVASEAAVLAAIGRYYARPGVTGKPGDLVLRALEDLGDEEDEQEQQDDSMSGLADPQAIDATALEHDGTEAPIVRLVSALLVSAIQRGASDVHVEPYESELRIRLRIDGVLHPIMAPPIRYRDPITSRLKIMANLDIAEKRLPQDGRLKVRFNDRGRTREIDFRVSSLPTLFGETIVLRVLDQERLHLDMTRLGLEPAALAKLEAAIRRPSGMVLVTGPTGSGKTNTLYSAITRLNQPGVNILTAEDPVEFNIQGVNQVQVREQIGLTFAAALRSFLRQDPNVLLVGEIRDLETAATAVKAALTGHLVLSTLHTNDAPGTVVRLVNMGIEAFLVNSSVSLVCAQRLVRRTCEHCREARHLTPEQIRTLELAPADAGDLIVWQGMGCEQCANTGYKGRVGLFEVMEMTEGLRALVLENAPLSALRRLAVEEGMRTLRQSGLQKVREGLTTIEEVMRATVE